MGDQLRGIDQQVRAVAVRNAADLGQIVAHAQHVGSAAHRHQLDAPPAMLPLLVIGAQQVLQGAQVEHAIVVKADAEQFGAGNGAPGQFVGVVLQQRVDDHRPSARLRSF